MLKVAHITDLHLGQFNEVYLGLNHHQRFLQVLADASAHQPDFYVLGGDYSLHDPDPLACRWLKEQLDKLEKPYYLLAGNHDDTTQLAEVFDLELLNGFLDYSFVVNKRQHIFLDTSQCEIYDDQFLWLNKQLQVEHPIVLWMHHPPCPLGVRFMDEKHCLKNWKPLMQQLLQVKQNITVLTGHYHANLRFQQENVMVNVCPPTSFAISPSASLFEQEDYPPAYQLLFFNGNRELVVPRYVQ